MIFAAVFAGGSGNRMGNTDVPKQYLSLGEKPVIIHTLEKFAFDVRFEEVLVLCPHDWVDDTKKMIERFIVEPMEGKTPFVKMTVIPGGVTRNDTLLNMLNYLESHYILSDDSIVLTHDAVRPFITKRIIDDNIKYTMLYGACDTAVPATDTIVRSETNDFITDIPPRSKLYQGQTPQSFNLKKLRQTVDSLTEEETATLTDACKIFVIKNQPVYIVNGETFNLKITYPFDLEVAKAVLAAGESG